MQRFVLPQLAEAFVFPEPLRRIEHLEGQSTISLKGIFGMELQDRISLGFI